MPEGHRGRGVISRTARSKLIPTAMIGGGVMGLHWQYELLMILLSSRYSLQWQIIPGLISIHGLNSFLHKFNSKFRIFKSDCIIS